MRDAPTPAVVLDIGGVLLDWDPRHLFRKLFLGDPAGMEEFLSTVCTPEWNAQTDVGVSFADAIAQLVPLHPSQADLIEAYRIRWPEMIAGLIEGMHGLVDELLDAGVPLYSITNFSTETFHLALESFPALERFAGIVVSGVERVAKPDPRLFRILIERFELDPGACLYVDDRQNNVDAAQGVGFNASLFTDAAGLRKQLLAEGVLPA